MAKKDDAVAKIDGNNALAIPEELAAQLLADSGQGFEGVSASDFATPFIKLLQALSPQLKKSDPSYIEEARAGDIVISTTGEMFAGDDGVRVVAVAVTKKFMEYVPRKQGGGFVAIYDTKEDGQANMTEGNELVETQNFYVLFESNDGAWKPGIISMSSSKLKSSRAWLGLMRDQVIKVGDVTKVVPMAGKIYRITAFEDKNRRNETYFNYRASVEGFTPSDVYAAAKALGESFSTGAIEVDFSKSSDTLADEALPESNKKF